jgi:hypothetical protein
MVLVTEQTEKYYIVDAGLSGMRSTTVGLPSLVWTVPDGASAGDYVVTEIIQTNNGEYRILSDLTEEHISKHLYDFETINPAYGNMDEVKRLGRSTFDNPTKVDPSGRCYYKHITESGMNFYVKSVINPNNGKISSYYPLSPQNYLLDIC